MSTKYSIFLVLVLAANFISACRSQSPFVKKASDYDYAFTDSDIAFLITFFSQDTSYLPAVDVDTIILTRDSLIVQYEQEKKCFDKDGLIIYQLTSYRNTYSKLYYTYSGKIKEIEQIVNGEIASKGIVDKDKVLIQVRQVSDPFW